MHDPPTKMLVVRHFGMACLIAPLLLLGFGCNGRAVRLSEQVPNDSRALVPDASADLGWPTADTNTPCELTEGSAHLWRGSCTDARCEPVLSDDLSLLRDGSSSLRFRCDGCGFDNAITLSAGSSGPWNLQSYAYLSFWAFSQVDHPINDSMHWQNAVYGNNPWLILTDQSGNTRRVDPFSDNLLEPTVKEWTVIHMPLAKSSVSASWTFTEYGAFDLSRVVALELHMDPWDWGFTIWFDGMAFGPGTFSACPQ